MSHRGFSLSVGHAARYKSHDSTCAEAAVREKLTANRKTRENISCDSGATDGFTATINKNKAIPGSRKPLQKTHMVKMGTTYAASEWQQLRQVIMHKSGSEGTALVMIAQLLCYRNHQDVIGIWTNIVRCGFTGPRVEVRFRHLF